MLQRRGIVWLKPGLVGAHLCVVPPSDGAEPSALRCGFYDEFHFSKRFRQFAGVTPAQFRRRQP